MGKRLIAAALCAIAISGCDRQAGDAPDPAQIEQDARDRAAAERQVKADLASVKAATLENRVARLEADVDEMKAQIGIRQDLASDISGLGGATPPSASPAAPASNMMASPVPAPASPAGTPKLPYVPVR